MRQTAIRHTTKIVYVKRPLIAVEHEQILLQSRLVG